jgi:hypothetical protein
MPTRLLKITPRGDSFEISLQTTNVGQNEKYIALSYCWGRGKNLRLEKDTEADFTKSIPFNLLPPTLQDAVILTNYLDISLLWIDALCIIQDDDYDKEIEISKMAAVYRHSYVTISASRARSSEEGFLFPRPPPEVMTSTGQFTNFKLRCRVEEGDIESIVLTPRLVGVTEREPLDSRGWTLQETLLSPRLLRITQKELQYICTVFVGSSSSTRSVIDIGDKLTNNDIYGSEGWSSSEHDFVWEDYLEAREQGDSIKAMVQDLWSNPIINTKYKDDNYDYHISAKHLDNCGPHENDQSCPTLQHWQRIVANFSSRSLTYPSDRLLGLSALAQHFGEVFGDRYLAGMWGKNGLHIF